MSIKSNEYIIMDVDGPDSDEIQIIVENMKLQAHKFLVENWVEQPWVEVIAYPTSINGRHTIFIPSSGSNQGFPMFNLHHEVLEQIVERVTLGEYPGHYSGTMITRTEMPSGDDAITTRTF